MFRTKTIERTIDGAVHTITIRQLSGRHLGKAAQENQFQAMDNLRRMGGRSVFEREFQKIGDSAERKEMVAKTQADPMSSYDPYELLYAGITTWTLPDKLERVPVKETLPDGREITVMRIPAIDDLSEEDVDALSREVLKLTKPSVFLTEEEAEEARKND